MLEVYPRLWVGNQHDANVVGTNHRWSIVHACKEPYHRQALGYTSLGAPKDHPEYLIARRNHRLILNLVDTDNVAFVRKEMIDAALDFIDEQLKLGQDVLVHCNQGGSRAPSIALLYLARHRPSEDYSKAETAMAAFRVMYPQYAPLRGMHDFVIENWKDYVGED